MRSGAAFLGVLCASVLSLLACKAPQGKDELPDAAESPQAQAVPAPLVVAVLSAQPATQPPVPDAGPPATPLREDQPLRDEPSEKPVAGVTYTMVLRPLDGAAAPKFAEVSAQGLDAARKKTQSELTVELGGGRMRMVLGGGFLLPRDTELRARTDHTGHVLLLPQEDSYRVVAPTALRALLADARLDVLPSQPADVTAVAAEGPRKVGLRTRQVRAVSRGARAEILLAKSAEPLDGSQLMCRFVAELMGAAPQTPICEREELPARVELRWQRGGGLLLEMTTAPKRTELPPASLVAPPSGLEFSHASLPRRDGQVFLTNVELAALRATPVESPHPPATPIGLLIVNTTDEVRVLWLDSVMVAWVAPGMRLLVPGLLNGRYQAELRSFLGDPADVSEVVVTPGALRAGPPEPKPESNK
jgi:hypothetical protein